MAHSAVRGGRDCERWLDFGVESLFFILQHDNFITIETIMSHTTGTNKQNLSSQDFLSRQLNPNPART